MQQGLASLDYEVGIADGLLGPATRRAIRVWQQAKGFAATGYLTREQADTLIAQGRDAVVAQQQQAEANRLAQEAAARAEAVRRAREVDEAAYAEAQRVDTAAAYADYLTAYPTGRYAAEARTHQQERAEAERLAQLPREIRNSIGVEFVLVEPGTFEMGSPADEPGRSADEGPVHAVTLSQPFYLGKYEVTQEQWQAVMGRNPSGFSNCGRTCPVEQVSWNAVEGFIEELNRREGVEVYRLPTEAEWEYAARGGTQTAYHFGNAANRLGQYGWYADNSGGRSHPVGQKRPNTFGLYDMHGNVWEWVADWSGAYPRGAVTDPRGPSSGAARVIRGGSWYSYARLCRAANRNWNAPGSRHGSLGFRLARTP